MEIERVQAPTTKTAGRWLIKVDGQVVGFLEKYKDSRTDTHPWKAFVGIGNNVKYLGSFYTVEGGKQAAIDAVVKGT